MTAALVIPAAELRLSVTPMMDWSAGCRMCWWGGVCGVWWVACCNVVAGCCRAVRRWTLLFGL